MSSLPKFIPSTMTWQQVAAYKHGQMERYQREYRLETFIETGTNSGDSVECCRHLFKNCYSAELHPGRYASCVTRFASCDNVHLFHGDSEIWLPELLSRIPSENILFWLDAHAGPEEPELVGVGKHNFSGLYELEYIMGRGLKNSIVMVDDVANTEQYPHVCGEDHCSCIQGIGWIAPAATLEMNIARVVLT